MFCVTYIRIWKCVSFLRKKYSFSILHFTLISIVTYVGFANPRIAEKLQDICREFVNRRHTPLSSLSSINQWIIYIVVVCTLVRLQLWRYKEAITSTHPSPRQSITLLCFCSGVLFWIKADIILMHPKPEWLTSVAPALVRNCVAILLGVRQAARLDMSWCWLRLTLSLTTRKCQKPFVKQSVIVKA